MSDNAILNIEGKEYNLPIHKGTEGELALNISKLTNPTFSTPLVLPGALIAPEVLFHQTDIVKGEFIGFGKVRALKSIGPPPLTMPSFWWLAHYGIFFVYNFVIF